MVFFLVRNKGSQEACNQSHHCLPLTEVFLCATDKSVAIAVRAGKVASKRPDLKPKSSKNTYIFLVEGTHKTSQLYCFRWSTTAFRNNLHIHKGFNPSSVHQMCCKCSDQLCLHSKSAWNLLVLPFFRTCQLGLSMCNWIELKKTADLDYLIPGSSVFIKGKKWEENTLNFILNVQCQTLFRPPV